MNEPPAKKVKYESTSASYPCRSSHGSVVDGGVKRRWGGLVRCSMIDSMKVSLRRSEQLYGIESKVYYLRAVLCCLSMSVDEINKCKMISEQSKAKLLELKCMEWNVIVCNVWHATLPVATHVPDDMFGLIIGIGEFVQCNLNALDDCWQHSLPKCSWPLKSIDSGRLLKLTYNLLVQHQQNKHFEDEDDVTGWIILAKLANTFIISILDSIGDKNVLDNVRIPINDFLSWNIYAGFELLRVHLGSQILDNIDVACEDHLGNFGIHSFIKLLSDLTSRLLFQQREKKLRKKMATIISEEIKIWDISGLSGPIVQKQDDGTGGPTWFCPKKHQPNPTETTNLFNFEDILDNAAPKSDNEAIRGEHFILDWKEGIRYKMHTMMLRICEGTLGHHDRLLKFMKNLDELQTVNDFKSSIIELLSSVNGKFIIEGIFKDNSDTKSCLEKLIKSSLSQAQLQLYLMLIEASIDWKWSNAGMKCQVCHDRDRISFLMIACDGCNEPYHLNCAQLAHEPEDWYCHKCSNSNNVVDTIKTNAENYQSAEPRQSTENVRSTTNA